MGYVLREIVWAIEATLASRRWNYTPELASLLSDEDAQELLEEANSTDEWEVNDEEDIVPEVRPMSVDAIGILEWRDWKGKDEEETLDCPICKEEFSSGDELLLPGCDPLHAAHTLCLLAWVTTSASCVICRKKLEEEDKE